jgi:hypothetical protein
MDDMDHFGDVRPASCWTCHATSERRPMGETPPGGWEKRGFEDYVGHGYLCSECAQSPDLLPIDRPENESAKED